MDRREILKYTALATGAVVSAPLISSLLVACQPEKSAEAITGDLEFFSQEDFKLVQTLVDIILPKTDSPSATEVGVHQMIDHMVGAVYNESSKSDYKTNFSALSNYLNGNNFSGIKSDQQIALLKAIEASSEGATESLRKGWMDIKQQTVAYYLTTEAVGTQFLNYLPVPGAYEPCITLEAAGNKAWAL